MLADGLTGLSTADAPRWPEAADSVDSDRLLSAFQAIHQPRSVLPDPSAGVVVLVAILRGRATMTLGHHTSSAENRRDRSEVPPPESTVPEVAASLFQARQERWTLSSDSIMPLIRPDARTARQSS